MAPKESRAGVNNMSESGSEIEPPDISSSEEVYRRLAPQAWFKGGKKKLPRPVPSKYFTPRPKDIDGISLNRTALISLEDARTDPKSDQRYLVALLNVSGIQTLGLSVRPDTKDAHAPD